MMGQWTPKRRASPPFWPTPAARRSATSMTSATAGITPSSSKRSCPAIEGEPSVLLLEAARPLPARRLRRAVGLREAAPNPRRSRGRGARRNAHLVRRPVRSDPRRRQSARSRHRSPRPPLGPAAARIGEGAGVSDGDNRLAITHISACRSFPHRVECRLTGVSLARRQCFRAEGRMLWPDSPRGGRALSDRVARCLVLRSAPEIADNVVKDRDLGGRQGDCWWSVWGCASHHGQPHNAPAYDAEHGDQVHQPIRGPQFGVFSAAA